MADCGRPSAAGGLCSAHRKRLQRTGRLGGPVRHYGDLWNRYFAACEALVEAESDDDFARAEARVRKASDAVYRARGWTPPTAGHSDGVPPQAEDDADVMTLQPASIGR